MGERERSLRGKLSNRLLKQHSTQLAGLERGGALGQPRLDTILKRRPVWHYGQLRCVRVLNAVELVMVGGLAPLVLQVSLGERHLRPTVLELQRTELAALGRSAELGAEPLGATGNLSGASRERVTHRPWDACDLEVATFLAGARLDPIPALRDLVAAAELHDIGKAAIPDAILEKKARLDAEERAFIERHTLIGERIIASAPSGRGVAAIIRATHERYDGRGYPDGLAGEHIPLAARIIAVCDAYNAMRSDRSYRSAMSESEAIAELEHCSGGQFDPRVTAVFLEMRRQPAEVAPASPSQPRSSARGC